jgi:hypothetical protein
MCTGVTSGLAGVKLSGSPNRYGSFSVRAVRAVIVSATPKMSFTVK